MIDFLYSMLNKNIEKIAIEGILNTKLSQLFCSKGIKFRQYSHSKPMVPNVYFMAFLPSGSGKNLAVDLINDYLMPFLKPDMDKKIDDYKNNYFNLNCQPTGDKKKDKDKEKEVNEYFKKISEFHIDVANSTFTGVFSMAENISRVGYGAINILISEFGDFIDNINSGDSNRKELFEALKDMSDGKVMPRMIAGETRRNLSGIPICSILLSDFEALLEERNNQYFKKMLKTGISRRSFLYIAKDGNKNKTISYKEKQKAQERAFHLRENLEHIYNSIPDNAIYDFSETSKELLENYHNECIDEFNKLKDIDLITAAEVESSFWKITKLSVIYSVLNNPTTLLIDSKYVDEAISFYKRIQPCLQIVIEKKADSPEDKLKKYLMKFDNGSIISRFDLRNQKFVPPAMFKGWIEETMPQISEELGTIYGYSGKGNSKGWQVRF